MPELIDREATLKKMCETCGYCARFENAMRSTHPDFVTDKCNNYKFLEEQPAIEAEPVRHGRWNYRHEDDWCYCTACGVDAEGNYGEPLETDYCPHCGARMDGGADNG